VSRRFLRLSEMGSLLIALGCSTSPGGLGALPSSEDTGGSTSTDTSTGGAIANTGGAASLGGAIATGGTTTQSGSATGGTSSVVEPTGGSTSSSSGATIALSMGKPSGDSQNATLVLTVPSGAAAIAANTLGLKLCGAGSGSVVTPTAFQIYDERITCPQTTADNCPIGSSTSFKSTVTVTGTGASCCFVLSFAAAVNSLAPGGKIELNYAQDANQGTVLMPGGTQTWTVSVAGQDAGGKCTITNGAVACS